MCTHQSKAGAALHDADEPNPDTQLTSWRLSQPIEPWLEFDGFNVVCSVSDYLDSAEVAVKLTIIHTDF